MFRMQALLLTAVLLAGQVQAGQPDLTTTAAFESTCATLPRRAPATPREQQAYVICKDVALIQHGWTFLDRLLHLEQSKRPSNAELMAMIRKEFLQLQDGLRETREVLEKIELKSPQDGLLVKPATWARDLNGDGTLSVAERNFFAIPRRHDRVLDFGLPSEEEAYYENETNRSAMIRIDQTDIRWAVTMHYTVEALAAYMLAYEIRENSATGGTEIRLIDPSSMLRARDLLAKGLRASERMRLSALAETDDDMEWLGNPRQASSVFPVPLDADDFDVWGELNHHLIPLVDGKTLLAGPEAAEDEPPGWLTGLCPPKQGLDIAQIFRDPPKNLGNATEEGDVGALTRPYCRKIDASRPASGLTAFITAMQEKTRNDGGYLMRSLRRLLWVH
ncbi:hypothetical protein IP91_02027 [Pseudoduganella lurida]|uniref:Uncharacterized protein n=1 Tax=Pseudoduganella lurida TaxID=1036180 RepID=A0A562RAY5_9BURK|nr:hypothetical protein [Pseudoduganella lurida]TWI66215.1 hypothetical protein IP91_02027 [Pseudoduganella lurida]